MLSALDLRSASSLVPEAVFATLQSSPQGLTAAEAEARLRTFGANVIEERRANPLAVLARQLANPFLLLLIGTALLSIWLQDRSDAVIILAIVVLSVGLSFSNEYMSERAVDDLRARIQRKAIALRDGARQSVDVADLVPGDVVFIEVGDIIPADLRLIEVHDLECDEAALTGEALPTVKSVAPCVAPESALDLDCCAYFGTVVKNGAATGVVVSTGKEAAFGGIAHQLSRRPPETAFQIGLKQFSMLLVRITVVLTVTIFIGNTLLHHPLLESLLFALAIAIGITPQLLPAIVTISLSFGARQLAKRSVLVKRLVAIEDLGDVQVLFTDKTGTLTKGQIEFRRAVDPAARDSEDLATLGLLCTDVVVADGRVISGNALDVALWEGATPQRREAVARYHVIDSAPFDYHRQIMSVLADAPDGRRLLIAKGAPEAIASRTAGFDDALTRLIDAQLEAGSRTIVLAYREAPGAATISEEQEHQLIPIGVLTFADEPKADAAESIRRLRNLKVEVKIVTGDSPRTAQIVCGELGIQVAGTLTGKEIAAMSDAELAEQLDGTTIFARVTPDQKSRIIKLQRSQGVDVGFLGDGVNDAVALHDADVGISVDSATDVAKDAADIVLLQKDLGILADGVVEGRRIFANTMKYVLMGTSSNFGNMFSAAGASLFLPFLPMLPSQILLNNLLYDISEMTIPTDEVDEEALAQPARWDIRYIERFMLAFGPISSIFDFVTFGVMIFLFHASQELFRTGWFVESLSTQSLVIFLIRTRRVPFWESRAGRYLAMTTLAVVILGMLLPYTGVGRLLGFAPLPGPFFGVLALMIATYLALVELGKRLFYGAQKVVTR